ncbi:16S rRNA (cytosine(1402)-N(4))-methyltransferase RsmH [Patescibacteria group bacterium]|nr:16S rRNA (cytosine(1402)-N(4))-methyltransferase RsmH [Patescibacteria group bacterium]
MYIAHQPVLLKEVIDHLNLQPGDNCIDGTLGSGGHSRAMLAEIDPTGRLLGIDADQEAISYCRQQFATDESRVKLVPSNFVHLAGIAAQHGFHSVQGILFDLGVSTHQLLTPTRGFSFQAEARLDMRFDQEQQINALEVVNDFDIDQLASIFKKFGEIKDARRLARNIDRSRRQHKITTTSELGEIVKTSLSVPARSINKFLARVFQAVRIAVNNELEVLEQTLQSATKLLQSGGRLAVISYHSLEDRIVKEYFRQEAQGCQCPPEVFVCRCDHQASLKVVTRQLIVPSAEEIADNPRSRSAKLRVAEKI